MDQAFFIHNFGEGETSIMSSRKEDGKGIIASHPPSLSNSSPVNYCNTKKTVTKTLRYIKKEGVRLLHSFHHYTLSGLSMLNYNRYLSLH